MAWPLDSTFSLVRPLFVNFLLIFFMCYLYLTFTGKLYIIQRPYVRFLNIIFEYVQKEIEAQQKNSIRYIDGDDKVLTKNANLNKSFSSNHTASGNHRNGYIQNPNAFIRKDTILLPEPRISDQYSQDANVPQEEAFHHAVNSNEHSGAHFDLSDCFELVKVGIEAIIEDEVISRFENEELRHWNLLTRTKPHFEYMSWKLKMLWISGIFIRYFLIFPFKAVYYFFSILWFSAVVTLIGCTSNDNLKKWLIRYVFPSCAKFSTSAFAPLIIFHNPENRPKNGICVANHTSPMDILMLLSDNYYSLTGQTHNGYLGLLQKMLLHVAPHIWFDRSDVNGRHGILSKMKTHVSNPKNPPILLFPEGTCVNNTSVMQFKKGSFEIGCAVYPIAIKYDPMFGDVFWNSSRYSFVYYLMMLITSWSIVGDIWYLPPMYRNPGENTIDFVNRVKTVIANQGGLTDVVWDGQLKRLKPKKEWMELQQQEFSKKLKNSIPTLSHQFRVSRPIDKKIETNEGTEMASVRRV